jgi:hypothetical protein
MLIEIDDIKRFKMEIIDQLTKKFIKNSNSMLTKLLIENAESNTIKAFITISPIKPRKK